MKNRVLICALSVVAAAAGCSRSVPDDGQAKEIIPIVIANDVGVESDVQRESRAPLDGSQATTLYFLRADQDANGTYGAYDMEVIEGSIPAGSGARTITFNPKQYYQLNGKKSKMIGFYPTPTQITTRAINWDLGGMEDIMTAVVQEGTQTSAMPAFTFKHKMAQLQFWVYADSKNTSDYWGELNDIIVCEQYKVVEWLYNSSETTGKLSFVGSPLYNYSASGGNYISLVIPVGASNMVKFGDPMMVRPITSAKLLVEFSSNIHVDQQITIPSVTFAEGQAYKVVLRFTDMGIVVEPLTIAVWNRAMQINDVDM